MLYPFKTRVTRSVACNLLIVPALLLAGCGGGGGQSSSDSTAGAAVTDLTSTAKPSTDNNSPMLTLEGVAMKGAIAGGLVTVYQVEQQAGYHQPAVSALTKAVRTAADGSYRIQMKAPASNALVVRVSADEQTRMTCDVTDGCKSSDGKSVSFGETLPVDANFSLAVAVPVGKDKKQTVHLTPLTHLAYNWAVEQSAGLTPENIVSARAQIATELDLPADMLTRKPLDVTKLDSSTSADLDSLRYAVINASFLALANSASWENISDVLDSAAESFATNGGLIDVNMGGIPVVTKHDLYVASEILASDLSEKIGSSSAPAKLLTQIAHRSVTIADELDNASQDLQQLRITFNPSSVRLLENETITLNVNAAGTGPIYYQWRKNGQPIMGATSEHLTLADVKPADAGDYDCIVSNGFGSVSSMTASVTVNNAALVLNWTIPESRVDGTPLRMADLKGYRILYGTAADKLTQTVEVTDPQTTVYSFASLPHSTYFFAIKAVDAEGVESGLSGIVSKTL